MLHCDMVHTVNRPGQCVPIWEFNEACDSCIGQSGQGPCQSTWRNKSKSLMWLISWSWYLNDTPGAAGQHRPHLGLWVMTCELFRVETLGSHLTDTTAVGSLLASMSASVALNHQFQPLCWLLVTRPHVIRAGSAQLALRYIIFEIDEPAVPTERQPSLLRVVGDVPLRLFALVGSLFHVSHPL